MSKNYKKKNKQEEIIATEGKELSKKEEYDLNKKKKEDAKKKIDSKKKKSSKNKKNNKQVQTNLGTRIFAIAMLLLMILSVIASAGAYLIG